MTKKKTQKKRKPGRSAGGRNACIRRKAVVAARTAARTSYARHTLAADRSFSLTTPHDDTDYGVYTRSSTRRTRTHGVAAHAHTLTRTRTLTHAYALSHSLTRSLTYTHARTHTRTPWLDERAERHCARGNGGGRGGGWIRRRPAAPLARASRPPAPPPPTHRSMRSILFVYKHTHTFVYVYTHSTAIIGISYGPREMITSLLLFFPPPPPPLPLPLLYTRGRIYILSLSLSYSSVHTHTHCLYKYLSLSLSFFYCFTSSCSISSHLGARRALFSPNRPSHFLSTQNLLPMRTRFLRSSPYTGYALFGRTGP